jgi:hypothetical protein
VHELQIRLFEYFFIRLFKFRSKSLQNLTAVSEKYHASRRHLRKASLRTAKKVLLAVGLMMIEPARERVVHTADIDNNVFGLYTAQIARS